MNNQYLRFGVTGVIDLGPVVPITGFLGLWVFDFLWWQHVPVILQGARLNLFIVNSHLVCLVWIQDQCVQVTQFVILEEGGGGILSEQEFMFRKSDKKRHYSIGFVQTLPCIWCLSWWDGSGPCSWRLHGPSLCCIHRCQALQTQVIQLFTYFPLFTITEVPQLWHNMNISG